jgi:hypothetical protein
MQRGTGLRSNQPAAPLKANPHPLQAVHRDPGLHGNGGHGATSKYGWLAGCSRSKCSSSSFTRGASADELG